MDSQSSILEVRNLSISFGDQEVVHDLSYALKPGKILGIVGESGSGKSVSSLALMGLLPDQAHISGSAILHGLKTDTDLLKLDKSTLETIRGNRIAMIFQEPMTSLNPLMKCGKQILEMLQIHQSNRASRKYVIQLLEKVQLPDPQQTYDKYPHQLSGGQKQRVMIAMAVACKPDILIADEPTTALDVTVQKEIITLLQDLVDENTALIFISHDLGLIADICDDILVMYQGKMVEKGENKQVILEPKSDYTKALLACRPSINYKLEHLPTLSDFMTENTIPDPTPKQNLDLGESIMSVKKLNVHFPIAGSKDVFFQALDNISFELRENECLGIVGESGSGKSTIANALTGLVKPSSGDMIYRSQSIDYQDRKKAQYLRKQIQIIFQDPYSSLNPKLKIGAAIDEVLKVNIPELKTKSDRQNRTEKLLQEVGLKSSDYDKYPHEFSGGQRQRVVIARALAVEPEVLICDESVSALDVSVQAQVLNLLHDLQRSMGLSMVFISHDLSVIRYLCQSIIVLQNGKVVEQNATEDLFDTPKKEYTQMLIDDIPGKEFLEKYG